MRGEHSALEVSRDLIKDDVSHVFLIQVAAEISEELVVWADQIYDN